jgi:glycosyltransferase involved in cell wall biosynthesis
MNIIYHHRTRSTDAQRIHILELVQAFEQLGHSVRVVGLIPPETGQRDGSRDAREAVWKRLIRRIPFGYEFAQLAYNLVGLPLLLIPLLTKRNVDFIYERYALFNFSGVIAARLLRIPVVLEVNSPFALEQIRDKDIRSVRLAQWAEAKVCNMASRVIVVSSPLRRLLENAGVKSDKLTVMANGVDLERFREGTATAELRERLQLSGFRVIGFVGWFRSWHGLELLLEAFRSSNLRALKTKLLLIGDGPAMRDLKQFTEAHGLTDSVLFTGPLPHDQVPPFLDLIDIAVQPAANEYCCPMKIIEYLALGKPIVAPAQENIEEILGDHETAFFSPGDAASLARVLEGLISNPDRLQEMSYGAKMAIHKRGLLWQSNAQRVIELLDASTKRDTAQSKQKESAGSVLN